MKGLRATQNTPQKGLAPPGVDLRGVRVTMVEPPFRVPHDFIDYPMFMNLGLLQNAAMLEEHGACVSVVDAIFSADRLPIQRRESENILGMEVGEVASRVQATKPDILLLHSSFFANPRYLERSFLPQLVREMAALMPSAHMVLADMFLGGLNYFPYNAAEVAEKLGVCAVLQGETDAFLGPVLAQILKGELKGPPLCKRGGRAEGSFPADLNAFPNPAFHLLPMDRYFEILAEAQSLNLVPEHHAGERLLPMMSSRGCPYACIFCTQQILDLSWRGYSAERLCQQIDELRELYGVDRFLFLDDLMNLDGDRFQFFAAHMAATKTPWDAVNGFRADRLNPQVLANMQKAGNRKVTVSAESADPVVLEKIVRKGLEIEDIDRVAHDAAELAYPCQIHYVIGFPGENREAINTTLLHAARMRRDFAAVPLVQYATPVEGTRLYRSVEEKGLWADEGARDRNISDLFYTDSVIRGEDFDPGVLRQMRQSFALSMRAFDQALVPISLSAGAGPDLQYLSVGDFQDAVRALPVHRRRLELSGEELLLHPELPEIFASARREGARVVGLRSHGLHLARAQVRKLLVDEGLSQIGIDLARWLPDEHLSDPRSISLRDGVAQALSALARKGMVMHGVLSLDAACEPPDLEKVVSLAKSFNLQELHLEVRSAGSLEGAQEYFAGLEPQLQGLAQKELRVYVDGFPPCMLSSEPENAHPYSADARSWRLKPRLLEQHLATRVPARTIPPCASCLWRVGCSGVPG